MKNFVYSILIDLILYNSGAFAQPAVSCRSKLAITSAVVIVRPFTGDIDCHLASLRSVIRTLIVLSHDHFVHKSHSTAKLGD